MNDLVAFTTTYESPIGIIHLASEDGDTLMGLWFDNQKFFEDNLKDYDLLRRSNLPIFTETKRWLDIYFSGNKPTFMPRYRLIGTAFQKRVWKCLEQIPYGTTTTYAAIAQKVAEAEGKETMSAQAVGQAVGHNPLSIIVPCHRVVAVNKALTGYAGGIERKVYLLSSENIDVRQYIINESGAF